jgi:hypothetical protein
MASLQGLLQRWGFVKLRRYGLELTPDGRILSTRPAVLDDGTGNPIVGWRDGDVSIWKFSSWRAQAAPSPAVATPVAVPPPAAPLPQPKPAITKPSATVPEPAKPSAAVIPVQVAAEPVVDEDDWEWTIALARARVAVEETEGALPPPPAPRLDWSRMSAEPPVRPTPRTAATIKDPASSGEWPATAPIGAIDYDDYSRVQTRPAVAIPRTTTPNTVIPVPALPTTLGPGLSRMEPVVRTAQVPPASASRFAKGTGPLDPPDTGRHAALLVEDTIPNLSIGDRTKPGVAMPRAAEPAPPPVGDRTKPGIALPPAARAVELPSIKRRMSPR